jgi:hypothetical protein
VSHHRDALAGARAKLAETIQERDVLRHELASERQRLRSLEQLWSSKLELTQSAKTAVDQRLRACEARTGSDF